MPSLARRTIRDIPPPTSGFEGQSPIGLPRSKVLAARVGLDILCEKEGKPKPYVMVDTPLERYTCTANQLSPTKARPDFKKWLMEQLERAGNEDRVLRVLDIGIGRGTQWLELLEDPRLELWGVALTDKMLHESIAGITIIDQAINLHRVFPEGWFDVVVSHYGTHYQEKEALAIILWLLKPEGEAIVCGGKEMPTLDRRGYEVIRSALPDHRVWGVESGSWMYWIRKLADTPREQQPSQI